MRLKRWQQWLRERAKMQQWRRHLKLLHQATLLGAAMRGLLRVRKRALFIAQSPHRSRT